MSSGEQRRRALGRVAPDAEDHGEIRVGTLRPPDERREVAEGLDRHDGPAAAQEPREPARDRGPVRLPIPVSPRCRPFAIAWPYASPAASDVPSGRLDSSASCSTPCPRRPVSGTNDPVRAYPLEPLPVGPLLLLRKKAEKDAVRLVIEEALSEGERIFSELAGSAVDARRRTPVQSNTAIRVVLDAAFLVPEKQARVVPESRRRAGEGPRRWI